MRHSSGFQVIFPGEQHLDEVKSFFCPWPLIIARFETGERRNIMNKEHKRKFTSVWVFLFLTSFIPGKLWTLLEAQASLYSKDRYLLEGYRGTDPS